MVEYCIVARSTGLDGDPLAGEEASKCVDHHDAFSLSPASPGRIAVWISGAVASTAAPGGRDTYFSQVATLTVRADAARTSEEYLRQEGFRLIYEFRHWSEHGGGSGHGSSLAGSASDATFLVDFVARFQVASLFDLKKEDLY